MKLTNPASRSCGERSCADVAPQLTALFDGEADAAQTSEARAHLLSCPACSLLWLDWTRYRDTFQREPAAAVPPTLLWRVLIAYRVTAFARPARRRSPLPQISAAPLRGIEAPLPPRLSAHILARTTRKSNAHVMLTPLQGAPSNASSRFKGRSFSFGRAPLWAAPALALWILMLGRTEFNATLPVATPDSAIEVAPGSTDGLAEAIAREKTNPAAKNRSVTPIPVATRALSRAPIANSNASAGAGADASADASASAPVVSVSAPIAATSRPLPIIRREKLVAARSVALVVVPVVTPVSRVARVDAPAPGADLVEPMRPGARAESGLRRAFVLALNVGQSDIARARTAPRALSARTRVAPVASPQKVRVAPTQTLPQTPVVRAARTASRPARLARAVPADFAGSRVTLAALASPISPVRTISSARLRTAAFSDDSMRPRVAHPSAAGRRLARLMPDEDTARLRVSRPIAQAPTLREASFGNADNGPRLDELRSAVDDYRASVAADE